VALTYATSTDVSIKWRPTGPALSTAESAWVDVLIGEASALLRRRLPGLDASITAGTIDATLARMVVTNVVLRVVRNPAGVTQQAVGPESATYAKSQAVGQVVVTDDDIAVLTDPNAASVGGVLVGTVNVNGPWWEQVEAWGEHTAPWSPAARIPPPWRRPL
jgi:hypothetical protein